MIKNNISKDLAKKQQQLADLPRRAYQYFHDITPIKTGNARRNTTRSGDVITASYPYARRLDEGYSKQAPRGMTRPTEEFIQREVDKILRKK